MKKDQIFGRILQSAPIPVVVRKFGPYRWVVVARESGVPVAVVVSSGRHWYSNPYRLSSNLGPNTQSSARLQCPEDLWADLWMHSSVHVLLGQSERVGRLVQRLPSAEGATITRTITQRRMRTIRANRPTKIGPIVFGA